MMIINIDNCRMEEIMHSEEWRNYPWNSTDIAALFKVCMIVCNNPDFKVLMQYDEQSGIKYSKINQGGRYRLR